MVVWNSAVALLTVASLVAGCKPGPKTERCAICQPYKEIVATMERTCLSNSSVAASASIKGSLDILKKAIDGDASVSLDQVRGARRDWEAAIGREENRDIRDCLKPIQEKLMSCIDTCIAGERADVFPPEIELQFRLAAGDSANPALMKDEVIMGVKAPPRLNPEKQIAPDKDGLFHENVAVPRVDGKIDARIHRAIADGYSTSPGSVRYTALCLKRATKPPANGIPMARLNCREGALCKDFDSMDPGWLAPATCDGVPVGAATTQRLARSWNTGFGWIAAAQAQEVGRVWMVPSIESLAHRTGKLRDGYTVFAINAADMKSLKADGVSLDLAVNGVEVRIEGMPGEMLKRAFDPGQPLHIEYALQNLDFVGRLAGCDDVTAQLRFWSNGKQVDEPVMLSRRYAALRDAQTVSLRKDGRDYSWSARYERSSTPVDYRVFVQSLLLKSWDDLNDHARVKREIAKLEAMRRDINELHLVYDAQPIVGVMRPPLSKPSWGLALGLLQKTGQIRFTFTKQEADRLNAFVREQRTAGNGVAARVFRNDSFVYIEQPNAERPSLCVDF